jgi:hypothetical protein
MRIQTIILSLSISFFSLSTLAGSDHDHGQNHTPVTQSQAEQDATDGILRLVEQSKIDGSWKSAPVEKTLKKKFGDNMEWVISFKNENITDPAKQIIYVFLTLSGEFLAANYTGE